MKKQKSNRGRKPLKDESKRRVSFWGMATNEDIAELGGFEGVNALVTPYVKKAAEKKRAAQQ